MTVASAAIRVHTEVLSALEAVDAERAAPGIVTELEATLKLIDSQIVTEVAELTNVSAHLFTGSSKLIRPIFLLLCAAAGDTVVYWGKSVRTMAAVIEIAHVATLYHDDVMDEDASRRGLPSANFRFGNKYAVVAGDLLLSRAVEMACDVGLPQCRLVNKTLRLVCQGQAMEMRDQYSTDRTVTDYLCSIAGKTAELFSAACAAGAMEARFEAAHVERFAAFGRHLGLAFKIVDDIHDVCSTEGLSGKPTMNDIREGIYTLPVVEAMRRDAALKRDIQAAADGAIDILVDVNLLRARITATGAVEHAKTVARQHITDARKALDAIPIQSESIATLHAMANALVPR